MDSKQFLKLHVCIRQLGNDKALPGNSLIEPYQNFLNRLSEYAD